MFISKANDWQKKMFELFFICADELFTELSVFILIKMMSLSEKNEAGGLCKFSQQHTTFS